MQTAAELFKGHPNIDKIKFIVHPLMKEHVYSLSDLPGDFSQTYEDFKDVFPNLDVSLMRNADGSFNKLYYLEHFSTWFPLTVTPESTDEEIVAQIQ